VVSFINMSIKASFIFSLLVIASIASDKLEITQNPSSLLTPRANFGCAFLNGTTVAFGGQTYGVNGTSQDLNTVEYSLSNGTFVYGPNTTADQVGPSYATFGDRYLFVTGFASQVLDIHTHTWSNLNDNTRLRSNAVSFFKVENVTTVVNATTNATVTTSSNVLYVFGSDNTGVYSFEWTVVVFDENGTIYEVGNWSVVDFNQTSYSSLANPSVVVANNKIYFIGGLQNDGANYTTINSVWSLDLSLFVFNSETSNFALHPEASLNTTFFAATASSLNNTLYVFGGVTVNPVAHFFNNSDNTTTSNVTNNYVFQNQVYSYDGTTWTTADVSLVHGAAASCAVLNSAAGVVYVLGGGSQTYAEYQLQPYNSTYYATVQTLQWVGENPSSHHGLGPGAIAGIVIGSLVGVAILIGIVVFISKRGKRSQYREV